MHLLVIIIHSPSLLLFQHNARVENTAPASADNSLPSKERQYVANITVEEIIHLGVDLQVLD